MQDLIPRHASNESFIDDAGGREKQDQRSGISKERSPTLWLLRVLKQNTSPVMSMQKRGCPVLTW